MESLVKQHRALLGALLWWYVRRRLKARTAALVDFVSPAALGLREEPKRGRAWWKWLLALTVLGGVAWFAWRRLHGGDDDWGSWEPSAPEPPDTVAPEPSGSPADAPDPAVPAGA